MEPAPAEWHVRFDASADPAVWVVTLGAPEARNPRPRPASDCWRCGNPGFALRQDGTVHCQDCMQGTPGEYKPLTPPG